MHPDTAQKFFIALNLIAIPAVAYAIYDPIRVVLDMRANVDPVHLHTGNQYYLLMSNIWLMWVLQQIGLRGKLDIFQRWGDKVLIGWFLGCLIVANIAPATLRHTLKTAGYTECRDPDQLSQVTVGRSLLFTFNSCEQLQDMDIH